MFVLLSAALKGYCCAETDVAADGVETDAARLCWMPVALAICDYVAPLRWLFALFAYNGHVGGARHSLS